MLLRVKPGRSESQLRHPRLTIKGRHLLRRARAIHTEYCSDGDDHGHSEWRRSAAKRQRFDIGRARTLFYNPVSNPTFFNGNQSFAIDVPANAHGWMLSCPRPRRARTSICTSVTGKTMASVKKALPPIMALSAPKVTNASRSRRTPVPL